MKLLFLLAGLVFFNSCARILNKDFTSITIHTPEELEITAKKDPILLPSGKTSFSVIRQVKPLSIIINSIDTIYIPARTHFFHYLNIPYNLGIGLYIDRNHPKRYTYPKDIYLVKKEDYWTYRTNQFQPTKGESDFYLFFPYVNHFLSPTSDLFDHRTNTGFLGFGIGYDKYTTDFKAWSIRGSLAINSIVPAPAPVHYEGIRTFVFSANLSISRKWVYRRVQYGIGLHLATWDRITDSFKIEAPADFERVEYRVSRMGLAIPLDYRVSKHFDIGIEYLPSLLEINNGTDLRYAHYLGFNFKWLIKT